MGGTDNWNYTIVTNLCGKLRVIQRSSCSLGIFLCTEHINHARSNFSGLPCSIGKTINLQKKHC